MTVVGTEQIFTPQQASNIDEWVLNPLSWAKAVLGQSFDPWSGQEALWEAYGRVLNAKIKRYQYHELRRVHAGLTMEEFMTVEEAECADKLGISIMSGHGLGKEKSITAIALHFFTVLKCYRPIVACTAPAGPTLFNTMWREFTNVITGSPFLPSLVEKQATKIFLKEDPDRGDLVRIVPRTIQSTSSPDKQGEVLAGMHSTAIMYCITEASGVEEAVFKPIEGGLSDPIAIVIMIFNPTKRTGFAADSHTKYRKHWVCLNWDARRLKQEKLAQPGRFVWFNEKAQDVLIEKYGEDSDTVRVRVIGLPAKQAHDTLIHYDAVIAASERQIEIQPHDPLSIGVDVGGGGSGGDPSVVTILRGPKLVGLHAYHIDEFRLADLVVQHLDTERGNLSPDASVAIVVDAGGIGRSTWKLLGSEKHRLPYLYGVDAAESPIREAEFHRLRDEIWWELREAIMETKELAIDPHITNYDALLSQLTTIKWAAVALNGRTRTKVQGKGSSSGIPNVKPLLSSPNEADSLGLAWRGYRHYCSHVPQRFRGSSFIRRGISSWKSM